MMKSETKTRSNNFIAIILLLTSTMAIMGDFTISPALPKIYNAFEDSQNAEYLVKLILSVPALFIALSSPLIGITLDRYGRKIVLIASVILYIISGTTALYLDSIHFILIGRAFFGIAVAGTLITSTTMIGDFFKGSALNKIMGYQSASIGLAGVTFLILGGVLADIHWRAPFFVYFIGFIYLFIILRYLPESPKITKEENISDAKTKNTPITTIGLIFLIAFFLMVFFYMIPIQIPFYLKAINVSSNTHIGLALSAEALISAISSTYYKKIKDYFSFKTIFILSFIIMGVGYIFISMVSNYHLIIFGLVIVGVGIGIIIPNINVCLITITNESIRGRIIGGMSMCYFLGQFCSQIFIQPIINLTSITSSFLFTGSLMIITPLLYMILKSKKSL